MPIWVCAKRIELVKEMNMSPKLIKPFIAASLSIFIFVPSISNATPSAMPQIGGKLGKIQAGWAKLGFTHAPKLVTQAPPLKSYHCRAPLPGDLVIAQDPVAGSAVSADTQVTLTLICHLAVPQNSVVQKRYVPVPGKIKYKPKLPSEVNKPYSPSKQGSKITISCVKAGKTISISGTKPKCPTGYKKK